MLCGCAGIWQPVVAQNPRCRHVKHQSSRSRRTAAVCCSTYSEPWSNFQSNADVHRMIIITDLCVFGSVWSIIGGEFLLYKLQTWLICMGLRSKTIITNYQPSPGNNSSMQIIGFIFIRWIQTRLKGSLTCCYTSVGCIMRQLSAARHNNFNRWCVRFCTLVTKHCNVASQLI